MLLNDIFHYCGRRNVCNLYLSVQGKNVYYVRWTECIVLDRDHRSSKDGQERFYVVACNLSSSRSYDGPNKIIQIEDSSLIVWSFLWSECLITQTFPRQACRRYIQGRRKIKNHLQFRSHNIFTKSSNLRKYISQHEKVVAYNNILPQYMDFSTTKNLSLHIFLIAEREKEGLTCFLS